MDVDNLNWKSVSFGDAGFSADFEGLLGIEECTDYSVVTKNKKKRSGKKKKQLKRKTSETEDATPQKKTKNSSFGDFLVEKIDTESLVSPSKYINNVKTSKAVKTSQTKDNNNKVKKQDRTSQSKDNNSKVKKQDNKKVNKKINNKIKEEVGKINEINTEDKEKIISKNKAKKNRKNSQVEVLETKVKDVDEVGKENDVQADVSLDNMQAWSQFNLPDVILKGLAAQNFTCPTMIQELTLPAAMFGRRDILGAAETGSGKTLAFGLPILNAILQMKQKPFMGVKDRYRKPKKVKSEENANKTNEKTKIVNYNKLNTEERKKLKKEYVGTKRKKNKKRFYKNEEDSEDDGEESETESAEEESDMEVDNDSTSDEENVQSDADNSDESNEDGLKLDNDDSESNEDDVNNDSVDAESDGDDLKATNKKKAINGKAFDSGIDDADSNKDPTKFSADSDDSDFDEKEEKVEGVNAKGIGCIKIIDNVVSADLPETNTQRKILKPLYALILTPTRELAIQVKNHLVATAKFTDISVAVVVGGMSQEKQERLLSRGPEIVVATPGRLWQMIQIGNPHLSQIADIRFFGIDETDRMLEHGHFEELHQLLERLNEDEDKRSGRQNFVFSATLTMVHDLPKHLKMKKVTKKGRIISRKIQKMTPDQKLKKIVDMLGICDPKIVDVTKQNQGASTTLVECRITCPIEQKDYYLYYVLSRHPGRTIIFCNSIGCVKRLSQLFTLLQCNPLPLHASMQQRQRLKNLDRFRADPNGVLVATDVAARGLDIPDVDHVIHYQVPRTAENYVHRSGRTARASKEGITILIMEAGEVQNYNKMCKTLEKTEDLPHFPIDGPLLSAVMQRVDVARELDVLMLKVRKDNTHKGWLEKAAKEMDMLLDERNMPKHFEGESSEDLKYVLNIKRKQLNSLLATPIFPKGFSFKYPTSNTLLQESLGLSKTQNAIEAMKTALESNVMKNRKKTTKNEALLKLEKQIANDSSKKRKASGVASTENVSRSGEKISKNKWKKMKRKG